MDIKEVFERYNDEFLKFELIASPSSQRPDLHAFHLLDALVPGNGDIVCSAEHDEVWLAVEPDALAKVATEDQIRDLVRCGVRYDSGNDSLCMFV